MSTFSNKEGALVVDRMISVIQENKQYLSDIDGAIADGDHGINMNKGFSMTREALDKDPGDLSHGLLTLAKVLMMRIGGSMGPLYGKTFKTMGKTLRIMKKLTQNSSARHSQGPERAWKPFHRPKSETKPWWMPSTLPLMPLMPQSLRELTFEASSRGHEKGCRRRP